MILTVDAGNTNVAIGLFSGAELTHHWRLSSRTHRTADEFLLHLKELLEYDEVTADAIDRCVISSVVPDLTQAIRDGARRLLGHEPVVVSPTITLPVRFAIDNPAEIGSDLVANAVAGHALVGACVVVDFGTALSFTAVDASGVIRGAAIAPGVATAVGSLVTRAAALPMIDLAPPDRYIGTNTVASLRSGILYGYAGLVDRVAGGMKAELGGDARVIATGGESTLVTAECTIVDRVEPWLTLEGLYLIALAQST